MLKTMKNEGIVFFLNLAACLFIVIGLIFVLVSNSVRGYVFTNAALIISMSISGLVLAVLSLLSGWKYGTFHIATVFVRLAVLLLIGFALSFIIQDRASGAGALYTWDSSNGLLSKAFYSAVVGAVCYLAAIIAIIIGGFVGNEKKR